MKPFSSYVVGAGVNRHLDIAGNPSLALEMPTWLMAFPPMYPSRASLAILAPPLAQMPCPLAAVAQYSPFLYMVRIFTGTPCFPNGMLSHHLLVVFLLQL